MSNAMTVHVEVWPVAADTNGLWLLPGCGPLRTALPVPSDTDVHAEAELELTANGVILADVPLLHSTSWRQDAGSIILTYVAVVRCAGAVRESWPDAEPISPLLPGVVGRPLMHGAAEPPAPRWVDCLLHAVRHLALLRDTDATAAAVLDGDWRQHLEGLRPALAGMYRDAECQRAA